MSNNYIGLNNQICENPKYFCKSHQIYLSEEDVKLKKCFCKPSFDMISTKVCQSIISLEEWEKEKSEHKERYEKIKESRRNQGWHVY